jgi:hypothetical protein
LASWQNKLDSDINAIKKMWVDGGSTKFQLIRDNWDKNILPSFRTSDRKTVSLHLLNMYALVDRVLPQSVSHESTVTNYSDIDILRFIPSLQEQEQLLQELTFIFATSVINNSSQLQHHFKKIYPEHLEHKYSQFAGLKTSQVRKYFNIYYF